MNINKSLFEILKGVWNRYLKTEKICRFKKLSICCIRFDEIPFFYFPVSSKFEYIFRQEFLDKIFLVHPRIPPIYVQILTFFLLKYKVENTRVTST